jgi:hypothetical protein
MSEPQGLSKKLDKVFGFDLKVRKTEGEIRKEFPWATLMPKFE